MSQIISFPALARRTGPPAPVARAPDPAKAILSEVWAAAPSDAGVAGFVLAALSRPGPVLWVQDRLCALEAGTPYARSLRRPVVHVRPRRLADALQAMETGLGCPALAGVIGEVWGDALRVDFTATKRLALRAEAAGVPCWLIRRAAAPALSAARARWRVASLPSAPDPWDDRAPGAPRWRAELFRWRHGRPGTWVATYDGTSDRLRLVPAAGDGPVVDVPAPDAGRAAR